MARARTPESKDKMVLAGATRAVNPQRIGGRRMAAFALQPDVAEFLDVVMHDENLDFRIQQVTVLPGSSLAGRSLAELDLQDRTGALLLAVRRGPDRPFEPNPPQERVLDPGSVLIALGTPDQIGVLGALARG